MTRQVSFDLIQNAYRNHNLDQVIDLSTDAINHVYQSYFISVLDARAHAFGIEGHFSKAIRDAEEMIRYAPTQAIGYLRLGQLLSIQGKQSAAIKIYEKSLAMVEKQDGDDPAYVELIQRKKRAMEKSEQRLDFITMLPLEIVDAIFEDFSEPAMFRCMAVSTRWREILLNCPKAWAKVYHNHFYYESSVYQVGRTPAILRALPHIARHIKNMEAIINSMETGQIYLELFENGAFQNIKTLELSVYNKMNSHHPVLKCINKMNWRAFYTNRRLYYIGISMKTFTSSGMMMSFTNALWQTRYTLTKLDLNFGFYDGFNISITDILFYSPYLKTLVMGMPDHPLKKYMGNMEYLGRSHVALEDVQIKAKSIPGPILKPLLQYCPGIRRLCLQGCRHNVIDVVDEICNEKLQIFAYNTYSNDLPTLEEMDWEYYDGPSGLRYIIALSNDDYGVPANGILRLLYKNQKSLQTVCASLAKTELQGVNHYSNYFCSTYKQWYFERLRQLTYRYDGQVATESMILESITSGKSTSLQLFSARETPNIPMIVNTLICLPPVEQLELLYIQYDDDGANEQRSAALVRLFQYYAALPPEEQNLHKVQFDHCSFITDQVLFALAQIQSLRTIDFAGSCTISSPKILKEFLDKVSDHLVKVIFSGIDIINDDILDALGSMEHLGNLELSDNDQITEKGAIRFVDRCKTLHTLVLDYCTKVHQDTYASRYIKSKIINTEIYSDCHYDY
ncbi:hypothetical protein BDA99DRAFT_575361 [Phascolomyces articulosus]|uniref:F-box domain-containing protein n=1 Tax=Phascolomyces articulosus TaxID=60185 RepID=A0AAD5PB34_9FUNG|nr:hypothetical protein BDA99DRAFT_575361 [Phascolomyces articulosus]